MFAKTINKQKNKDQAEFEKEKHQGINDAFEIFLPNIWSLLCSKSQMLVLLQQKCLGASWCF